MAEAANEDGFLMIGGTQVMASEQAALAQLGTALGVRTWIPASRYPGQTPATRLVVFFAANFSGCSSACFALVRANRSSVTAISPVQPV